MILDTAPSTDLEAKLQEALRASNVTVEAQKKVMQGMQAQTVLHSMYLEGMRGQLQAKEEKKLKKRKIGKINMDGWAKILMQDDIVTGVQEWQDGQDKAVEEAAVKKKARVKYTTAMEIWKVQGMDQKGWNAVLKAAASTSPVAAPVLVLRTAAPVAAASPTNVLAPPATSGSARPTVATTPSALSVALSAVVSAPAVAPVSTPADAIDSAAPVISVSTASASTALSPPSAVAPALPVSLVTPPATVSAPAASVSVTHDTSNEAPSSPHATSTTQEDQGLGPEPSNAALQNDPQPPPRRHRRRSPRRRQYRATHHLPHRLPVRSRPIVHACRRRLLWRRPRRRGRKTSARQPHKLGSLPTIPPPPSTHHPSLRASAPSAVSPATSPAALAPVVSPTLMAMNSRLPPTLLLPDHAAISCLPTAVSPPCLVKDVNEEQIEERHEEFDNEEHAAAPEKQKPPPSQAVHLHTRHANFGARGHSQRFHACTTPKSPHKTKFDRGWSNFNPPKDVRSSPTDSACLRTDSDDAFASSSPL
ncbi:hypothetical protein F5148DRAFT_1378233 [Russula earlei]|uniref:Uncharacterized protein n=1 Tax=Russula earlei TaxID=71964 RepID=A0ACC0TZ97_9AGAM|nr:hypothetical protein F5148DRAFT_1378233 [Russula earlei]